MKLELGKYYITNDGETVKMGASDHPTIPFRAESWVNTGCGGYYDANGCYTGYRVTYEKSIKREATEVEAALYVLQQVGEVTFKPKFADIVINDVGYYSATITAESLKYKVVKVGCNNISFDKVKEVYAAVVAAEKAA